MLLRTDSYLQDFLRCLRIRAVLLQAQMLTSAAMKVGFSGGLVVDFPHSTRAKKYFLVLMVGSTGSIPTAKGLSGEEDMDIEEVQVSGRRTSHKKHKSGAILTVQPLPSAILSLIAW